MVLSCTIFMFVLHNILDIVLADTDNSFLHKTLISDTSYLQLNLLLAFIISMGYRRKMCEAVQSLQIYIPVIETGLL